MRKLLSALFIATVLAGFALFPIYSDQYIGGKIVSDDKGYETVTCATNAGTASPSVESSFLVTDSGNDDNEDTVSLADGNKPGDIKIFTFKTDTDTGDSVNVTPASFVNSKIVFDTEGEGCILVWDGSNWVVVANNGGTIS